MTHRSLVIVTTLAVLVGTFLATLAIAAPSSEAICAEPVMGAVALSCEEAGR